MSSGQHLAGWSAAEIRAECGAAWRAYRAEKTESYKAYFAANPHLTSGHPYVAKDLAAALPVGWADLAGLLPVAERHRHHLSANSSQTLALAVFGVGARLDPTLAWLWDAFAPLPRQNALRPPAYSFEHTLDAAVLDEQPRQTSIDVLVDEPGALIAIECKWTEEGMGACGCGDGAAAVSDCNQRVRRRDAYWDAARDILHLPERHAGTPCHLSFTYQAVRNVAAALALAKRGQQPVFALVYDAANPFFGGCGSWPGWAKALDATLNADGGAVRFAAASWQDLVPLLPPDAAAGEWLAEKHDLH